MHQRISRLKGKNGKCLGNRAERRNGRRVEKAEREQGLKRPKRLKRLKSINAISKNMRPLAVDEAMAVN